MASGVSEHFGRLDVVVDNAGCGHFGFVEELSEQEFRDQLETNVFGAMWVTQAALPILREQGSGHILQVSSIGGISAFPMLGAYHASKWALEGFSQSLAAEVAPFGIHVTLIEPGGFATNWSGPSAVRSTEHPAYADVREKVAEMRRSRGSGGAGDPQSSASAVLEVVDAEEPPLRVWAELPGLSTSGILTSRDIHPAVPVTRVRGALLFRGSTAAAGWDQRSGRRRDIRR